MIMKVYKRHTAQEEKPYIDNCYYSSVKEDAQDTEVTTPEAYIAFYEVNQMDYKKYRDFIKDWEAEQGGFDMLSFDAKAYVSDLFLCTPEQMINYYVNEMGMSIGQAVNMKIFKSVDFNKFSMKSREMRYGAVYIYVRNVVTRHDLNNIANDLELYKFTNSYIEFGREGSMKINYEGLYDEVGIFDYITGTQEWSDYQTGLGITPTYNFADRIENPLYGLTAQNIIDNCMIILDQGIY